jgi:hypothetical protein
MANNNILESVEYFRIAAAAEKLNCSAEDLLHLGAIGKAEIIAPVLLKGSYEWPVSMDGTAYPESEPSFRSEFDILDHVILLTEDLKRIEAVGWAIPRGFFSPMRGMEIANYWRGDEVFAQLNLGKRIDEDLIVLHKMYLPDPDYDEIEPSCRREEHPEIFAALQECAMSVAWYAAPAQFDDIGYIKEVGIDREQGNAHREHENSKTTIEHLFLSRQELTRLAASATQDGVALKHSKTISAAEKVHGNAKRYSSRREQVLAFAIYCKSRFPEQCGNTAAKWAEVIDEKAGLFWKEDAKPPLSRGQIERLLGDALAMGK